MESRLEALVSRRRNDYGVSVAHCTHKSYHGRSCVKSRLQELSSELRKSAQAERLTRLSKSRAWELNYELGSVAMIIYIPTNFFYRPVIAYLQRAARVRRWPQRVTNTCSCVAAFVRILEASSWQPSRANIQKWSQLSTRQL